jgi:Tol biopolymer transport system component/predicted Ser/Thr protein kinase
MSLSAGTRLGPYEILAPLGAGGMGEVYRARDPRMGREVAIKVSTERFSDRFEREVHAVAALNHHNICHLYDVGPNYLVMELVEGSTLAERIASGAIPLEESLKIGRQITEALEAAHEKGIVHRDLKPANVKITREGVVKVLDFGLAKLAEPVAIGESEPTLTATPATCTGVILGTAAYMSPEQARGMTVDKRADIWAFGVVLYEMLTGRRLFDGESVTDCLAAVLTKGPEWERVPAKARQLLRSCLEKDPKRRLRDIGDAWRLLEDAPLQAPARTRLPWAVAGALAVVAAIALWAPWRGVTRPIEQPLVRLDLDLGPDVSLRSTTGPAVILSPDGTRLVFVSQGGDGTRRLFIRLLDQPKATQLSGTEGAYAPFFSPDGQWVGFFARGKLKKTRIDGGEPVSLSDAPAGRGASWGEDRNIIAALDTEEGLSQVSPEGGKAVSVTSLSLGETTHRWPQILPGGKTVLFTITTAWGNHEEAGIAVVSLPDHRRKTVLEHAGMYPRYLPSGHLVYVTKGALFTVPFDLDRLEVRGSPTLLEEVSSNPTVGSAQIDFSRNGTFAYRTSGSEGLRTMQWLDGAGETVSLGIDPALYIFPRLSPDGSRLACMVSQGSSTDLWIYDWLRGSKARLTSGILTVYPVWSPDGRFVVFHSVGGMFWTRADGAGKPQPLTQSKSMQLPSSFTPDGTRFVFSEQTPGAGGEIRTVPVESGSGQMRAGEPQLFLKTSTVNTWPTFSPDGRWLAYADAPAGTYEVYVRAFPDNGTQVQISNAGGTMPFWSRNGRELFYRTEDQRIMVANYTVKGGTLRADKPQVWFGKQLANTGVAQNLDLAPDGKRFVVLMAADSPEPRETQSHVKIATNFFDEIRRRMAAQGK